MGPGQPCDCGTLRLRSQVSGVARSMSVCTLTDHPFDNGLASWGDVSNSGHMGPKKTSGKYPKPSVPPLKVREASVAQNPPPFGTRRQGWALGAAGACGCGRADCHHQRRPTQSDARAVSSGHHRQAVGFSQGFPRQDVHDVGLHPTNPRPARQRILRCILIPRWW